ncbi:sulfurtransferase TusA family protein [Moraxella osloensis]|nr:sulfurtransferase TusA family protein [Moraxella osloensis]MDI4480468.1 sulfurtransferase TusA family protein [Moraxella osloensis]
MTASSQITLNPALLSDDDFCQDWGLFHSDEYNNLNINAQIEHYVDGKGLACPMPLLKLKMALKKTALGHAVYVTATDPNSKRDIAAFCQHAGYTLVQHTSITPSENTTDTIFHSIITKSC